MKRKGITPVIAVVLLLLITVGAVASAWGLYQQITSDQSQVDQLNQRQAAASTDISAQSVYNSTHGYIMADLRNQGSEPVNLSINGSDIDYSVSPPSQSGYFEYSMFDRGGVGIETDFGNVGDENCFWNEGKVLGTDSTLTCNTTIKFPDAGQTYDFRLSYQNVDGYSWGFEYSPSSADAIRCD